jgi:hypothetical protein
MTWRKRIAKEWLWLTGTVAATLVGCVVDHPKGATHDRANGAT